jgi:hypothetical protein
MLETLFYNLEETHFFFNDQVNNLVNGVLSYQFFI